MINANNSTCFETPVNSKITDSFAQQRSSYLLITNQSYSAAMSEEKRQPFAGYRVFSHHVTAAILVPQNNETAAMLVSQTNPLGVELFSYGNAFFCFDKFA